MFTKNYDTAANQLNAGINKPNLSSEAGVPMTRSFMATCSHC